MPRVDADVMSNGVTGGWVGGICRWLRCYVAMEHSHYGCRWRLEIRKAENAVVCSCFGSRRDPSGVVHMSTNRERATAYAQGLCLVSSAQQHNNIDTSAVVVIFLQSLQPPTVLMESLFVDRYQQPEELQHCATNPLPLTQHRKN